MNESNDAKLRDVLRSAIPPVADTELKRDLWPRMLRKMEHEPAGLPWFDIALAALLAVCFAIFPEAILGLLYHL